MTKKRKPSDAPGSQSSKARAKRAKRTASHKQTSSGLPDSNPGKVRDFKIKLKRIKDGRGNVTVKRDTGFKCGLSMGLTRGLVARLVAEIVGHHSQGRTSVVNVGRIG